MKDNVKFIVSVVGDEQLTLSEIATRVQETQTISKGAIQRWLVVATKQGLLDRVKAKNSKGGQFIYFAVGEIEAVEDCREPYVIQVFCSDCGLDRKIEFRGNVTMLQQKYGTLTWTCNGCGNYVRLSDCIELRELIKLFTNWVDSHHPNDIRYDPAFISS